MDRLEQRVDQFAKIGGGAGAELLQRHQPQPATGGGSMSFAELRNANREMQFKREPCWDQTVKLPRIPGMTLPSQEAHGGKTDGAAQTEDAAAAKHDAREAKARTPPSRAPTLTQPDPYASQEEVEEAVRGLVAVTNTDPRQPKLSNGFTPAQA